MKDLLKNFILLGLLGFTIYLCFRKISLEHQLAEFSSGSHNKTDTVYLSKPFVPEKPHPEVVEPEKVTFYSKPLVESKYSMPTDSLVQLSITRNLLKLTIMADSVKPVTKEFALNLDQYSAYLYDAGSGQLTAKKISRFHVDPYISYTLKPFHMSNEISLGVQFKTKPFIYKVGFDISYYPNLSKRVYKDLSLSITYNF